MINVNGREIETDAEGYLASLDDWSEDVAQCLAERDQLALADEHWQVVRWIREYYAENGTAPNLRVMSKLIGGSLGEHSATRNTCSTCFPTAPPSRPRATPGCPNRPAAYSTGALPAVEGRVGAGATAAHHWVAGQIVVFERQCLLTAALPA